MNIAVNMRLLLSHRMEGIARYIYETTSRMVEAHPEHTFHLFFDRPFDPAFVFGSNTIPHVIRPPARHPILWWTWFETMIPRYLKRINADVFYSGDNFLSLKAKTPTLMVSHDISYHRFPAFFKKSHAWYYNYFAPRYHKRADHIVTVSEFSKKEMMEAYDIDPHKITVAYNSAPDGFAPASQTSKNAIKKKYTHSHPYLIYVGSFHPRKNVERLLLAFDAFKQRSDSDIHLLLYGRMAFKTNAIVQTYNTLAHKAAIHFVYDTDESIPELVGSAEGLVYPSLYEGFGIPILEGFHAGVPVLTANATATREVAGNAAILVDPLYVADISSGIEKLVVDEAHRKTLITLGHQRKDDFSWDMTAKIIYGKLTDLTR